MDSIDQALRDASNSALSGLFLGPSARDVELLARQMQGMGPQQDLMGCLPPYSPLQFGALSHIMRMDPIQRIKEGHVKATAEIERIDSHHVLIIAGCKKAIVHDRKELKKKLAEMIEEYVLPEFEKK